MAPADARSAREVKFVTSLARGHAPQAGLQEAPYEWRDLMDGDPPHRREDGESGYAVYHGDEALGDARAAYATLVTVRNGVVHVNGRILVRRPFFHKAIRWERRWSRRFNERVRTRAKEREMRSTLRSQALPSPLSVPYVRFTRWRSRVNLYFASLVLGILGAAIAVPDRAFAKVESVVNFLGSRSGRRELMRGVRQPSSLTPLGKSIVLAVTILSLTLTLIVINSIFSLFPGSSAALAWSAVYSLVSWGLLTALLLPTPYEVNLFMASIILGVPATIVLGVAAKILGGWMVFFLGDMLGDYVEKTAGERGWTARLVRRVQAGGSKYGPFAMGALLAIPFYPETFTLYIFGSLNPPMKRFLTAVAVGMTIRFWLYFTGLDVVAGLLQQF